MKSIILGMIIWTIVFILNILDEEIRKGSYILLYMALMCALTIGFIQEKQISTQKEYIECLEQENWQQVIELDSQKESEHQEKLEEMRNEL